MEQRETPSFSLHLRSFLPQLCQVTEPQGWQERTETTPVTKHKALS